MREFISEVVGSNRFEENSDINTTYLGRVDKENQHKLKAEESFPISEHGLIWNQKYQK